MPTITQNRSLTPTLNGVRFDANGDIHIDFQLIDSGGAVAQYRSLTCKADGTGIYDQRDGSQVAAVTPAALLTGAANIQTVISGALASAVTAGKLVA